VYHNDAHRTYDLVTVALVFAFWYILVVFDCEHFVYVMVSVWVHWFVYFCVLLFVVMSLMVSISAVGCMNICSFKRPVVC